MGNYIAEQFEMTNGTVQVAADGLYPNSTFFEAKERYYFPKTSNKWTAKVLRKTGYPISPFYAVTSGNVIKQSAKHGEVIQSRNSMHCFFPSGFGIMNEPDISQAPHQASS